MLNYLKEGLLHELLRPEPKNKIIVGIIYEVRTYIKNHKRIQNIYENNNTKAIYNACATLTIFY